MKILHVNTYGRGGAAKACIRLHESLVNSGVDSSLLLLRNGGSSVSNTYTFSVKATKKEIVIKKIKNFIHDRLYFSENKLKKQIKSFVPDKIEWFSFPDSGLDITKHILYKQADIVHLHWVADFLDYSFLKKNKKPLVWTLHDMNPFTGGCHYGGDSKGYQQQCLNCPQLQNTDNPDYAAQILQVKHKAIRTAGNVTIVTPSKWLSEASRSSTIFKQLKHSVIPYGLDSSIYHPIDKTIARKALELPLSKKIILFVSDAIHTPRKGFSYLLQALDTLYNKEDYMLCTLGSSQANQEFNVNFLVKDLGYMHDEEMICKAYSSADVFVIPSLMDNFPNTVLESLLCGTPVVGFAVGGIQDMIQHGKNGLLCTDTSSELLAGTLQKFFDTITAFDKAEIRKDAVERYDLSVQLKAYSTLYREIVNS